jgi:FKBP-type peptidyl-prolyl cis-trans isomerase FkpA
MASHKKRKSGSAGHRAAPARTTGPAATATTAQSARRTTTAAATAARPATTTATVPAAKTATRPVASTARKPAADGVVRRAPVQGGSRRARSRYAQRRRQRRRMTLAAIGGVAALVVVGLAIILWPKPAPHHTTHTPAWACTKGATPGAIATPAPTPPCVSGKTVTTTGGLQYIDIAAGTGQPIKAGDTVTVQYTGWLKSNGQMFDSSLKSGGQPFQVANVGNAQVIQGWNIGLVGMKLHGVRRLIIPAALAYGAQGAGSSIPPNADLIFDVTVVSIP